MTIFVCRTCAVEQPDTSKPPAVCAICSDERQYVRPSGQQWTTLEELGGAGHRGTVVEVEPGLYGITIEPSVGIGQRALLVQTPAGNLLWDPSGYLDDDLVATVRQLGGVAAVAASHPHCSECRWSGRTGSAMSRSMCRRPTGSGCSETIKWWQRGMRNRGAARGGASSHRRPLPRERGCSVCGRRRSWGAAERRHRCRYAGRALDLVHAQLSEQDSPVGSCRGESG